MIILAFEFNLTLNLLGIKFSIDPIDESMLLRDELCAGINLREWLCLYLSRLHDSNFQPSHFYGVESFPVPVQLDVVLTQDMLGHEVNTDFFVSTMEEVG